MSEATLQRSVAQLINARGWFWTHPPGEVYLHGTKAQRAAQMARMKADGYRPGEPDVMVYEPWERVYGEICAACEAGYFIECPKCGLCEFTTSGFGVALELKVGRNKPTPAQEEWMQALDERGWLVGVCRNMDQVMTLLACVRAQNGRRI
jgi:hypothetical protein